MLLVFFDIFVSFRFPNSSIESTVHLALVVLVLGFLKLQIRSKKRNISEVWKPSLFGMKLPVICKKANLMLNIRGFAIKSCSCCESFYGQKTASWHHLLAH